MGSIEPPRPAAGTAESGESPVQEPPTARALWPTFLRRTLEEDQVRASGTGHGDAPRGVFPNGP